LAADMSRFISYLLFVKNMGVVISYTSMTLRGFILQYSGKDAMFSSIVDNICLEGSLSLSSLLEVERSLAVLG
jgi:hypothetical protein